MRVEKFNENHDEHGRFDTGTGSRPDPMPPADPSKLDFQGSLRASNLGTPSGDKGKSTFKVGKTTVKFDGSKVSVEKAADLKQQTKVGLNAIEEAQGGLGVDNLAVNVSTEKPNDGNDVGTTTAWYQPSDLGTLTLNGALNDAGSATASLSIVHEYGHMLDYERTTGAAATLEQTGGLKGMHFPGTSFSEENDGAAGHDNQMGILNSIAHSDGFTSLAYQGMDKSELAYFANPQEVFARGYSQWVTTRSADPTMLKQLDIQRNNYVGLWSNDDYKPIGAEYDKWAASAGLSAKVQKSIQPFYMVGFLKYNENHDEHGRFSEGDGTSKEENPNQYVDEKGNWTSSSIANMPVHQNYPPLPIPDGHKVVWSSGHGQQSNMGIGVAVSYRGAKAPTWAIVPKEESVQKFNENHDEKGMFTSGPAAPASLAGTSAGDLHSIIDGSHSPNSPALDRARTRLARQSNDGKVGSTNLSSAAEAIKSPDGGFTFNPGTGETATHGFAVGIHPELSQQFDVAQMSTPEVKSTIANYAAKNSAVLAQPGNFMGGWHDPETGKGWLDVSKVVPTARMARNLSTTHDQISFYDMQRGESVTVNAKAKSGQ